MYTDNKDITTPLRILLIEDDEDDYVIINELLKNIQGKEYDLTWISSYEDSFSCLLQNQHDVCLLDYQLGTHTGIDLLKKVNSHNILIPIIFLTGQGQYSVDIEAMNAGASDYLVKESITPSMLERSIRYTIERASAASKLKNAYNELEEKVKQRTIELQKANENLNDASNKIKSFAYSISHDLKSPSTALIGLVKRFYEIYHDSIDEKGKVYCEQIKNAATQIHSLVGMINGFITAKEISLKMENINLEEIINYIEANYSDQFSARKIKWIKPEKLPTVRGDRLSLTRMLINLIENALKYGGRELSVIKIEINENYNEYILSIYDNGKGMIKTENLDIFQAFERGNASHNIEGNGLGLTIVKELAERHGWDVWYDSNVQKGASFHISISKSIK